RRRFGWVTFHGPMAASQSLGALDSKQAGHLTSLLSDSQYLPSLSFPELETWYPGTAEGSLTGGCLSLIAASLGTPYEIKTAGKILFLEELGEPPYRIDRMLTQLILAGKLDSVTGILLGSFIDCEPAQASYTLKECLQDIITGLHVPVLANFPAGHGFNNWAIPLGVKVRLNADGQSLEFLEAAVS
ncbi:MAG TPA: LD-carboxypeptidase, partial [Acidobacteriota bacterium]|nr:LD-carboxypeptidase [Acidobacteriota bacterium]